MAPIFTPLHPPFFHPEAVTCWQDYVGAGNDLIIIGILVGFAYLQWKHLTWQDNQK